MKIKELKLRNFAKFREFNCEFNDRVTRLVGANGSGKTTVGLTAVWACLKGIAEKASDGKLIGERFKFIGDHGKSADLELLVYDEATGREVTVKNHITKSTNKITCEPVQDEHWLRDLMSASFLSADNFCHLDSKKQPLLLGIDPSTHDEEIAKLKAEYTQINAELKALGTVEEVEKPEAVQRVSVSELLKERDAVLAFNKVQVGRAKDIGDLEGGIGGLANEISNLAGQISELNRQLDDLRLLKAEEEAKLEALPKPEPSEPTDHFDEQMASADETNAKAAAYEAYLKNQAAVGAVKARLGGNKTLQAELQAARVKYLQDESERFGFQDLTVDENGRLLLKGREIREPYFSKAEREIIVARLYASLDPTMKVRFIDDFELLDDDNQQTLIEELTGQGFQVITAEVRRDSADGDILVLTEADEGKDLI